MQLHALARDGEANEELVVFFSKFFGVPKRQIKLATGHKSRNKIMVIEGLSVSDVRERIDAVKDRIK